jgi:putative inorganic carbon (HCO3(-)) transporter
VLLWRPKVLTILAGAGAAIAVASLPVLDSERVSSHLSLTRGTSFIRVQLWESSLRMIQDHPLLGVGMDNFLYHYRSGYMLPEAVAEPNLSHPHNFVLTFWLQMGIAGLAAFLWLLVTLVRMWHAVWSMDPGPFERAAMAGVAGATVDMVVHGLVDNSYFLVDMAFYFWLSMAVVAALFVSLPGLSRME